jgi:DNA primase
MVHEVRPQHLGDRESPVRVKKHGTETVLIAYDRDDAGEKAASALAEKLVAHGITCYRIQFPKGMDANEYACKVTPAEKSLAVLVRNAIWLGKGKASPSVDLVEATRRDLEACLPCLTGRQAAGTASAAADVIEASAAPSESEAVATSPEPAPDVDSSHVRAPAFSSLAALAAKNETGCGVSGERCEAETPIRETGNGQRPTSGDEVAFVFGDRRYRVRGLSKNLAQGALKVNLLVSRRDEVHVDTLELYSHRQRTTFVKQASAEIGSAEDTIKRDVGQVLLRLEQIQDEQIQETLKPKSKETVLSEAERAQALDLLSDPKLLDRILSDFESCGVIGEETNKLLGYLAAVSRKLEEPLAVILQSSSAAGKSSLMEAILAFMPEEDRVKYSAMTGQSLFYMGETDLKHKILAIVEEQGAEKATYALKLLQSEGELTIASTGKDPATGRLVTQEYRRSTACAGR